MDSSEAQPKNASSPILVTLSGISIEISDEQFQNALSPILVISSGIATVSELPRYFLNTPFSISKSVMGEICPQSLRAAFSSIWQGHRDSFIFLILSVELGGGLRRVLQRGFHGECLNTDDFGGGVEDRMFKELDPFYATRNFDRAK